MKYTDRFMKLPVDLYDVTKAELLVYNAESNDGQSYVKINPLEISFYGPTADDSGELTQTLVHFRGGNAIVIKLEVNHFEELLNIKMQ